LKAAVVVVVTVLVLGEDNQIHVVFVRERPCTDTTECLLKLPRHIANKEQWRQLL